MYGLVGVGRALRLGGDVDLVGQVSAALGSPVLYGGPFVSLGLLWTLADGAG
jgi:hypothetical protein